MMQLHSKMQHLADYIKAGGSSLSSDPDVKDDYFYLVNELGEDVLNEEFKKIRIELGKDNG